MRQNGSILGREILRRAMAGCFARGEYEQAADYALQINDAAFIHDCISAALGRPFGGGRYRSLQRYFDCMEAQGIELSPRVLLARGMYLSSRGQFFEVERCLSAALPELESTDHTVWLYAIVHKARILRNRVSIEESSRCLDSLLPLPEDLSLEDCYLVMIEKIHNLTLTTRLSHALGLTLSMIEKCLSHGNTKVKAWFERYLTAIYFYKGDHLSALRCYEKSLSLSGEKQDWLLRHCVGACAAKAYQVTGQEEKVLPLMEAELSHLRRLGLYEELSLNYLFYAEILLAEEMRNVSQGKAPDFSSFNPYLSLAEEHARLNRSTQEYALFAKALQMCAELLARPEKALQSVGEILPLAEHTTPFFQAFIYGRVANALHVLGREPGVCKKYYMKCIEIEEAAGTLSFSAIACSGLAAIYLQEGDETKAGEYTCRFMELSLQYGQRYYLRLKGLLGRVLRLADGKGITPEFTREMLSYGGYTAQRVYINTLGNFYIAPAHDRNSPVKIRTQKARELLAYLLKHREGVTRDRICADLWEGSEANVTSLFHTRRGKIRRAFESLGAANPIREDTFLEAAEALLESFRESGERAKTMELLRRCTGLSYHGHRHDTVKENKRKKK